MSMFIDIPTAISAGLLVAENRNKIVPWFQKVQFWFKNGRIRVLIFGPGGVGKSTVGRYLSGEILPVVGDLGYNESIILEKYTLDGGVLCDILVPPGQTRREHTWTELFQSLASGESQGIINVVAAGYHSFNSLSYQETQYYKSGMSISDFMAAYTDAMRQRELDVIEKLVPRICDAKSNIWMITLVTKQDLWWNDRKTVEQHYMQGEYDKHIKEIQSVRGAQHFAHEYLSASLVMNNLTTSQNEVLAATTSGYDQNLQLANWQKFNSAIDGFVEKGG